MSAGRAQFGEHAVSRRLLATARDPLVSAATESMEVVATAHPRAAAIEVHANLVAGATLRAASAVFEKGGSVSTSTGLASTMRPSLRR